MNDESKQQIDVERGRKFFRFPVEHRDTIDYHLRELFESHKVNPSFRFGFFNLKIPQETYSFMCSSDDEEFKLKIDNLIEGYPWKDFSIPSPESLYAQKAREIDLEMKVVRKTDNRDDMP